MHLSKLRQIIKEEVQRELQKDNIINTLSDISLSLSDIQKELLNVDPSLVDKLAQAKDIIQNIQEQLVDSPENNPIG